MNFEPTPLARTRELRDRETLSPAGIVVDAVRDAVPGDAMRDAVPRDAALEPPLVVDLDGTLLRSDLLVESFSATGRDAAAQSARRPARPAPWQGGR